MANFKTYDILVHICCSVDSHFFLQELQKKEPRAKILGFFYDPNIHPYSEYLLRLQDVRRSCQMLHIDCIEGEYDVKHWLESVRGLEKEPEKGSRCSVCFDVRVEKSIQKAQEFGIQKITTTLLASPKKSLQQLHKSFENFKQNGVEFLCYDFRKEGGTNRQFLLAKQDQLYHQNYCGCLFALKDQRENMGIFAHELISEIGHSILPCSIEERLQIYSKRDHLESEDKQYHFVKQRIFNSRILRAYLHKNKQIIPSHFLLYSSIKNRFVKNAKVDFIKDGICYLSKAEAIIVSLASYNSIAKRDFESVTELIFSPKDISQEIAIREKIIGSCYSCNPIIIIDTIDKDALYDIFLESANFESVRENLVTI